ncbi:MAG TPA: GerMN domain-containing protein [Blastococcus sp.]|jgi:spore germination protein GerM|nr:GerMN domain-containing protein [Blastococcus sp.]
MSGGRALLLVCLLALLAGCGVTTGGAPRTIAPSEVPYNLASPSSSTPTATSAPPRQNLPRVYFVDAHDVLVPSGRTIVGSTVEKRLTDLLEQLANGPTTDERDHGLATALPPGIRLTVGALDAGTVTVDISGVPDTPTGKGSRRAVGQIVLTATSLPEVRSVLLTHDGVAVEAPLPSGELSSGPLTAADYAASRRAGHS